MHKTFRPPPPPTKLQLLARTLTRTPPRRAACLLLGLLGTLAVLWILLTGLNWLSASSMPVHDPLPAGTVMPMPRTGLSATALPAPDPSGLSAQVTPQQRHDTLIISLILLGVADVAMMLVIFALASLELAYGFIRYNRDELSPNSGVGILYNPFTWAQRPLAVSLNLGLWSIMAIHGVNSNDALPTIVALFALQFTVLPILLTGLDTLWRRFQDFQDRRRYGQDLT